MVYGLQSQLELKEKKNEELYNACTRTVLRMGDLPTFMLGDCQRDQIATSRQLMMPKTQHLLFDVAEHFTHGVPETTCDDGNHESRLDHVFATTAALRAVRRHQVSQEQVVPKHELLVVEINLEMYTATQVVMVRQVKLQAPGQNKVEKNFGQSWDGRRRHIVERCEACLC